jgi:menaquinone-dependent protoporphyrinogen oxidase
VNVLVVVASRHGSTREIAATLAGELRASGHTVDLREAGDSEAADGYDAVVVGSAIYMGDWLQVARAFVARNRERLTTIPVWLFSSGPLERDVTLPNGEPRHLTELILQTSARGHRIFVGKLDKSGLGLGERLIVGMVKAQAGDFRDWDAVRKWGREIADSLVALTVIRT